ncbi:cysteine and histidine-rich domain-containing protein morgana [Onthophagus taurus]|uniref:cysteine and histidine-rich domain-containing protein morgana n=1 Tax=Onthophagus taurus TaxID=166361 RepID=UPI0039BDF798
MSSDLLQCYNRGCGKKYDVTTNTDKSCQHHPGEPFFHDAYKGWSCCNKKCTDFTEFLNIKGCTFSQHSNVKPIEPEKTQKPVPDGDVIEVKPIEKSRLKRPSLRTELVLMKPLVAPTLRKQFEEVFVEKKENSDEIVIGTSCKNGGCTSTYQGPISNDQTCTYHPGVPIFHEGMKYWSCCQRKTSDFNAFLNQAGCESGSHLWVKKDEDSTKVQCRWDYHQTGTHVVVSIYAKQYCPDKSEIKLNPIRLYANLIFPNQNGATFNLDVELCGIIDVSQSKVSMFGTKVEINMRKAEAFSWSKLEINNKLDSLKDKESGEELGPKVEGIDLSDL